MIDEVLAIFADMPEIVQHAILALGVRTCGCFLLEEVFGGRVGIVDLHCNRLRLLGLRLACSLDLNVPSFFLVLKSLLQRLYLIILLFNPGQMTIVLLLKLRDLFIQLLDTIQEVNYLLLQVFNFLLQSMVVLDLNLVSGLLLPELLRQLDVFFSQFIVLLLFIGKFHFQVFFNPRHFRELFT